MMNNAIVEMGIHKGRERVHWVMDDVVVDDVGESAGADEDSWNAQIPTGADRLMIFAKNVMSLREMVDWTS